MKKYLELIIAILLIIIGIELILCAKEAKERDLWEKCKDNRFVCYTC